MTVIAAYAEGGSLLRELITDAIKAAENDALERVASWMENDMDGDSYYGPRIRSLKHKATP